MFFCCLQVSSSIHVAEEKGEVMTVEMKNIAVNPQKQNDGLDIEVEKKKI